MFIIYSTQYTVYSHRKYNRFFFSSQRVSSWKLLKIKKKTRKPDSVLDGHLSRHAVARVLKLPTRRQETGRFCLPAYLALHRMGFAVPPLSPETRWSLTPPFHPYHLRGGLISVALSLPFDRPMLSVTLPFGVRTFLPRKKRRRPSGLLLSVFI